MEERLVVARLAPRRGVDRRFDLDFWRRLGPEARFAAAWEMVAEVAAIRGQDARQPRLQRTLRRARRG